MPCNCTSLSISRIQPPTGSSVTSGTSASARAAPPVSILQRSKGGVMMVVRRTINNTTAYSSSSKTPMETPIVAKIRPTSPRGIMPIPMSSLSVFVPRAPTAANTLPRIAITVRIPATIKTCAEKNFVTSVSIPICMKNTGMKMLPRTEKSRATRS